MNKFRILLVVILSLFFMHPFVTWFVADDYVYMKEVQSDGIFSRMIYDYLNWDGRCISLTYPISRLGLWIGKSWFGPLIGSIIMLLASVLIVKLSKLSSNKNTLIQNSVLVLALIWLASFNISSQTLYWTTGISYQVDILLLISSYFVVKNLKKTNWNILFSFPLFFYVGTVSPGAVLALYFILIIEILHSLSNKQSFQKLPYILFFILSFIGFLFVVLSPGNANRLTAFNSKNLTHIWTIYFNIKRVFSQLFEYNTAIVWMLIAIGLVANYFNNKLNDTNKVKEKIINLIFSNRWLIAAFMTVCFFIPFPDLNSPRTNIHFIYFSVIFALNGIGFYLKNTKSFSDSKIFKNAYLLIGFVFVLISFSQLFDARFVQKQMNKRDEYLKSQKGIPVILTKDDIVRPPQTRKFEDVSNDTTYWLNKGVANYYGLPYIIGTKDKFEK